MSHGREGFMAITISVVRETMPGERRVALTPDVAKKLKARGAGLLLERGAGESASFPDVAFKDTEIAADAPGALARADVLLTVQPPSLERSPR
jgi:NAD(P) transhydrogenase subunit alpha